ncbi:MAG: cyanophycin synthetase [Verrucomicrobia bacterium]|nr:MAG: cyanophycin synthetase [Verrucomicrobiota bacterium]
MPDLEICEINLLRGPNVWANYPVLEAWVDLGGLNDASSDELPGFNERLKSWLPGLIEHRCSVGERGGFFQRLDRGTYPAHILEHVTLELQTLAGHHLGFGKARATPVAGIYKVVVRYLDEVLVVACLRGARELLLAAYCGEPFDVAAEVARLRAIALRSALGPSTMAIVNAARDRGIAWRRVREGISLVQLGHGAQQRRVWTAETDRSGAISEYIAHDKDLTRMLLRQAGVPVPLGRKVDDPDDAWDAAESMDTPVVVKPLDANHGRGVFINLVSETQVRNSFGYALEEGGGVVVEKFVPGSDHRLLVVGSEMVAASKGYPAVVVGDGSHSIRKLVISQLHTSVQTGRLDECPWSKIDAADWETAVLLDLEDQGFSLDSVPRDGERVMVARFSTWCIDVTDDVHPSIRAHAVTAASVAGLDICGVDVLCRDISLPLEQQEGAIVELNASPNLLMFLQPAMGVVRPVGEAIIDMLFPDGRDGRIPTIGVTGSIGKTTTIRLLARLLQLEGTCLGVASSDGIRIGQRVSDAGDGDRLAGAHGILLHPWTQVAICEAGAEHILSDGLGFDRVSVGVVLNVGSTHLGHAHIETLDEMSVAKRCIVDVVLPTGTAVLNADDLLVAAMADKCKGAVMFFTCDPNNQVAVTKRAAGGRVVVLQDGVIYLTEGTDQRPLCPLAEVAMPEGGERHAVPILAAVAAAWAHGLSEARIAEGLVLPSDLAPLRP